MNLLIYNWRDIKNPAAGGAEVVTKLSILNSLMAILKDVDHILHQAAITSVPRSIDDPMRSNIANVDGTLNLLICARDSGVKRVVYASSSSVYGDSEKLPKTDTVNYLMIYMVWKPLA